MTYNFDQILDRRGTHATKWDVGEGELPMWIADMDFPTAPEIQAAIQARAAHGIYGYTDIPEAWYDAICGWWGNRHGFRMEREWLLFSTSVVPTISSVVPTINFTIEHMCQNYFHQQPMIVAPGIKTGINIKYENPRELGSDRIANAVAAYTEYGGPCIYIDFGTATTFGVVDEEGSFLGGCICPGIKVASEALVSGTAKLPRFAIAKPENVIGRTTLTNLQSGMYYGYVGLVSHIVHKIKQELGRPDAIVVATGGMAVLISEESKVIDKLDGLLTLKGLRLIYERNHGEGRDGK